MLKSHRLLPRAQFGVPSFSRLNVLRQFLHNQGDGCGKSSAEPEGSKKRGLFVSASEIANLISANPYVSLGDAVERLWEKNNKRTFAEALARNKLQSFTQEERLKELGVLEMAAAVVESEDVKEYEQGLRKTLTRATTLRDKSVIRDYNTSRGIKQEKTTFEDLQRKDPSAKLDTDAKRYQQTISIPNSELQYRISGYIDGVETNNQRIIEIKNRQSRLFNHVPLYEQVQCQAYLFLTGLEVCEHTESFRGALLTTTLRWEPVFWTAVVGRLNKVVLAVDHLLKDAVVQDMFLESRDLFASTNGKIDRRKTRSKRSKSKSTLYEVEVAVEIELEDSKEELGK
jgi:hypothetical protein